MFEKMLLLLFLIDQLNNPLNSKQLCNRSVFLNHVEVKLIFLAPPLIFILSTTFLSLHSRCKSVSTWHLELIPRGSKYSIEEANFFIVRTTWQWLWFRRRRATEAITSATASNANQSIACSLTMTDTWSHSHLYFSLHCKAMRKNKD